MSHITTYKTEIRLDSALSAGATVESDPGYEILRQAVEACAAELGLEVSPFIRDYYNRAIQCDFALWGPSVPRGVGVKVSRATGAVEFVYDDYGGYDRIVKQICETIVQNYQSIAVARALESLNYTVEYTEDAHPIEGRTITVKGVL